MKVVEVIIDVRPQRSLKLCLMSYNANASKGLQVIRRSHGHFRLGRFVQLDHRSQWKREIQYP